MKTTSNKLDQIISIKITEDIKTDLDKLAKNNNQTRSSLIRFILCKGIGRSVPRQITWSRASWNKNIKGLDINQR